MNLRQPIAAGSFYEGSPSSCRLHAQRLIESMELPGTLPARLYGGIVPHAGWAYSGQLAAETFKALLIGGQIETIVLFGADHRGTVRKGEVFDSGFWRTPLGDVPVDAELAQAILKQGVQQVRANPAAHADEHSLEVQIPLLQALVPAIRIVPIGVPPTEHAVEIGRIVGRVLAGGEFKATIAGSSDLTHHAGHFPAPGGHGETGVKWSEKNDRRMLDLVQQLAAEKIVAEAEENGNACGAGAIAACVAAAVELGAKEAIVLDYTNSYRIIHQQYPDEPDDTTVGYASVVFA